MTKKNIKIGQILERGIVPCSICEMPHDAKCVKVNPIMENWEMNGHAYRKMTAEEVVVYLQNQLAALMQ